LANLLGSRVYKDTKLNRLFGTHVYVGEGCLEQPLHTGAFFVFFQGNLQRIRTQSTNIEWEVSIGQKNG